MSAYNIGFTCSLCLSKRPLTECRLLKCYHGFCEECVREWLQSQKASVNRQSLSCPECRTPAQESHLAPLFVHVVVLDQESESQNETQINLAANISRQASFVAKGLERIGARSEINTIARAGKEIEKVTTAIRELDDASISVVGEKVTEGLVRAVEDFKQRIVPVFEQVVAQQGRLDALQKQVGGLTLENKTLKSESAACQDDCEAAILLSKKLTAGLKEEKALSLQRAKEYDDEIQRLNNGSTMKDIEIRRLKDACARKDEEISRHLLQISNHELALHNPSSSQNFPTSESDCVVLSSEDDEPYPTPTSPSVQAKSRQDYKLSSQLKPKFPSDWNLERPSDNKKRKTDASHAFPVRLDDRGRPKGSVCLGTRKRFGKNS